MLQWLNNLFSPPEPAGPPRTLRRFAATDATVTTDSIGVDGDALLIEAGDSRTLRLYELEPEPLENGLLTYRAEIRTQDLQGRAYLEMWCQFDGQGEYFSKGLHNAVSGSNDWCEYEIPFRLKKKQSPGRIRLNLTLEGHGRVWMRNVEIAFTPFG